MLAYHWLKDDMTAGSGTEPAWTAGEKRRCTGKVALCSCGYHSSPTLYEALQYAPGPVACIVEVSDPVAKDTDKQVSKSRKLIAAVNVKRELLTWAADCVDRALVREREAGREPDKRSWDAIAVLRRYVDGNSTQEEMRTAANAANAAASAAYAAAYASASAAYAAAAEEKRWQAARFEALVASRLPVAEVAS